MPRGTPPRPLRGPEGFAPVLKAGVRVRVGTLRGFALSHPTGTGTYLGISVPRRKVPRATDRNRYKRVIRESARVHLDGKSPLLVVIIVDGPAQPARNSSAFRHDLETLWQRLPHIAARQNPAPSP